MAGRAGSTLMRYYVENAQRPAVLETNHALLQAVGAER